MAEDPSLAASVRELGARPGAAPKRSAPPQSGTRAFSQRCPIRCSPREPRTCASSAAARRGSRTGRLRSRSPDADSILVARDLGPAEIAELELGEGRIVGVALAEGSATAHAAIVARSLGLPMAVALGTDLAAIADGSRARPRRRGGRPLGRSGRAASSTTARESHARERRAAARALADLRGLPAETLDGRAIALLCNAASPAEIDAGLAAGAAGVGLLRTELAFLEAPAWPTEQQHCRRSSRCSLRSAAAWRRCARSTSAGTRRRRSSTETPRSAASTLMLAQPDALAAQLRAIVRAGAATRLRILLPLVESAAAGSRRAVAARGTRVGAEHPVELGAMIETPAAACGARRDRARGATSSRSARTISSQSTLGLHRDLPLASAATAADPAVLAHVASVVAAAHAAGITVEVCGEAAGVAELVVLFVGLGVDELSVAPARVDLVRGVVRVDLAPSASAALAARGARRASAAAAVSRARSLR